MKDNGNFPFLANQTGKFASLMTSRQTLLYRIGKTNKNDELVCLNSYIIFHPNFLTKQKYDF